MALEQWEKELVAIGASIGTGCSPCLEHHLLAGRNAGLTEPQLAHAIDVAERVDRTAGDQLSLYSRELLASLEPPSRMSQQVLPTSHRDQLVALGTSIGANCHPLLAQQIIGLLGHEVPINHVRSAVKMAQLVQRNAAEITAGKVASIIEAAERSSAAV